MATTERRNAGTTSKARAYLEIAKAKLEEVNVSTAKTDEAIRALRRTMAEVYGLKPAVSETVIRRRDGTFKAVTRGKRNPKTGSTE